MMNIASLSGPTFFFIGVSTGHSSALRMWPAWMHALGRPEVAIQGVDLPLHAAPAQYREVVDRIKGDPLALGALVTSHKIDLYDASHDLFDRFGPYAQRCRELSSISKRGELLYGHATDPIAGGRTLRSILGDGYFARTGAHVLLLGGGGAASALSLYLAEAGDGDRPERILLVDMAQTRLDKLQHLLDGLNTDVHFEYVLNDDAGVNDRLMAALPERSLVINATGMGKDRPGSPVSDAAYFPRGGVVWELNYRGALDYLHQARRQASARAVGGPRRLGLFSTRLVLCGGAGAGSAHRRSDARPPGDVGRSRSRPLTAPRSLPNGRERPLQSPVASYETGHFLVLIFSVVAMNHYNEFRQERMIALVFADLCPVVAEPGHH